MGVTKRVLLVLALVDMGWLPKAECAVRCERMERYSPVQRKVHDLGACHAEHAIGFRSPSRALLQVGLQWRDAYLMQRRTHEYLQLAHAAQRTQCTQVGVGSRGAQE